MAQLSFVQDIRQMFRDSDIQEMKDVADFDLSKYEEVCARANDIYERVSDGSMPCDAPWPEEQVTKFKQWMDDGMSP